MKAYVFPGQGAQKKGMGGELFDEFLELTKKADEILGYSIKELCLKDPDQKLGQTQFTQPAMYTVSALTYLKKIKETGKKPDFLAGHSLGEYNALFAAGVFDFETGLSLVKKRGALMSKAKKGAMAAIIGLDEMQIRETIKEANLNTIDVANFNSPSQIIISGLKEDITASQPFFEKKKARFIPLNTSGAFHSRHMKDAAEEFKNDISQFQFAKPETTVIANISAIPYEYDKISQNLIQQIYSSVQWTKTVEYLLEQGVTEFEEIGVGDTLTKFIAQIKKEWGAKGKRSAVQADQNSDTSNKISSEKKLASNKVAVSAGAHLKNDQSADELVEHWNKTYPIGTKVISKSYEGELETRTEAMVLFGHRAAVYIKGYNGYFDLRELNPVK